MNLADADVMIDTLRKKPEAMAWYQSLSQPLHLPGYVAVELIQGCRDSRELRQVQKLLAKSPLEWGTSAGLEAGLTALAPLVLSHGLSGFDLLIAAVALETGATLYTFNHKHFGAVPGLTIAKPYIRP